MTVVPAPPSRRYRLTILNAENRRSVMGRHHIDITDTDGVLTAQASLREGTDVRFTLAVSDITQQGSNQYELHGDDGVRWRLSGCGCGK